MNPNNIRKDIPKKEREEILRITSPHPNKGRKTKDDSSPRDSIHKPKGGSKNITKKHNKKTRKYHRNKKTKKTHSRKKRYSKKNKYRNKST